MRPLARLAAVLSLTLSSACYLVETQVRELPPRTAQAPRPPPPPQRPLPRAPPPSDAPPPREPGGPTGTFHVPPDRVPAVGLCRIWYDPLPPDRQPAAMSCARAHRVARNHGGRVIWASSARSLQTGDVISAEYAPVDLDGIPPDRLPPPGFCRVWLDGVPPDRQPPPAQCPQAERDADRMGGRLIYMPSSDL